MMISWAITILAVGIALWMAPHLIYWGWQERRARRLLQSRDEMDPSLWIRATVGLDHVNDAEEVLLRLSKSLRVDQKKLRPEDRLDVELLGIFGNPDGTSDDIDEAFMDECDRYGVDQSLGQGVSTIADYIRLFVTHGSAHTVCVVPCEPTREDQSS